MAETTNIQIRAKEWLRNLWDDMFDRSKFHSRGELFESILQFYKRANETGVTDDREELQQEITDLKSRLESLKEENNRKDEEISRLKQEIQQGIDSNSKDNEDFYDELIEAQEKLKKANNRIEELEIQNRHIMQMRDMREETNQKAANRHVEDLEQLQEAYDELERRYESDVAMNRDFEAEFNKFLDYIHPVFEKLQGQTGSLLDGEPITIETHEDALMYIMGRVHIDGDEETEE